MTPSAGLYIHIPFCAAKCHYCDFVTFTDKASYVDSYLESLRFELSLYKGRPIKTIFIGGGTPTVLSVPQVQALLNNVHETLDTSALFEATVEANPESATSEKLQAFKEKGINRISFGVQASQNKILSDLGRLHDFEQFLVAFKTARSLGFSNINIDLMFGLPNQTTDDWELTLAKIIELSPEHISCYALKIEPGTEFARRGIFVDGDIEADMYLHASDRLIREGYVHYEISNFSRPGKESQHNLLYWENKETIGIGISAASYQNGRRLKNTSSLSSYLESCQKGQSPLRTETLLLDSQKKGEDIMLALRLKAGVKSHLIDRKSLPLIEVFLKNGLAREEGGIFSLTPRGWLLSNQLFQHFVS